MQVLIVDDSEIFRRSLRTIVDTFSEWHVCGEAKNADEGLRIAEKFRPEAILMDISMPGMNGLEALQHLRSTAPDSKVLILSLHESKHIADCVMDAGADGYVVKGRADSDLLEALNTVIRGETFVSTVAAKARATQA